MSKKGRLGQRIKGVAQIVLPLILSSLDRIETVSTAMELRRFGQRKIERGMRNNLFICVIFR